MRLLHLDLWTILFWRTLFGAISLFVYAFYEHGRDTPEVFARIGKLGLAFVPVSALGMICYVAALSLTTVADVMIIYSTMPFVLAAVAWLWGRERPEGRTMIASLVALVGVAITASGSHGTRRLLGDLLTFSMNLEFAFLMVMARRRSNMSMTPINALAALLCSAVAWTLAPGESVNARDLAILAVFGFTSIGVALALVMAGARLIPPAKAGLVGLLDVVLAPLWVWLAFSESPGLAALAGGVLVLSAVIWHLSADLKEDRLKTG